MQVCKCICFITVSNFAPLSSNIIVHYHTPKQQQYNDAHSLNLFILAWIYGLHVLTLNPIVGFGLRQP